MATRIRTLDFLPEIFRTPTNAQFLAATLDQLVAQPNTEKIQGYVGSKFGYGVNATNNYVIEPTKTRTDYQLDPSVVFLKSETSTATDFISYPGFIDALNLKGGVTNNNDRLFNSQIYSWDSFTDLDKIINFNQYYWLPVGPERVTVTNGLVYQFINYTVTSEANDYAISSDISGGSEIDPTLTLLRGGTYTFKVNQNSQFWIQGETGVTGLSRTQPNIQTRQVYGVTNNGIEQGIVTFTVPSKDALNQYIFPGNNFVDVISTLPFSQVNGARVSDIDGIDGVTALNGLTLMFYTSQVQTIFYTITLIEDGETNNAIIQLTPSGQIPTEQKITARFGTEYINREFYKSSSGFIQLIPYNSAILDTLYYQDGTNPNKVGKIRLIDSNYTDEINVNTQILGRKTYTSPNGVVFTNGLKVIFQGNIFPESYKSNEYYVEGVGTAIHLVDVNTLVSPGEFSEADYIPYDTTPYDVGNFDSSLYVSVIPDYITIARESLSRNSWSRANRWFHIDVIKASALYNNAPELTTQLATAENKAARPIIEFYPNLKLFNSGVIGKDYIDFIDTKSTDAFLDAAGKYAYYPDTAGYTSYNATITPVTQAVITTATQTVALTDEIILDSVNGIHVNDTVTFGIVTAGSFQIGESYTILSIGTTDFTAIGAVGNDVGVTFVATGAGTGTGTAGAPAIGDLSSGVVYYVTSVNTVNSSITISKSRQGTNVELLDDLGSLLTSVYPYSTTITIPTVDVFGLFEINQYVSDTTGYLPQTTLISDIEIVGSNTVLTVYWFSESIVQGTSVASIVSANTQLDNYSIFNGARIVFAADANPEVRNKIYVTSFSSTSPNSQPVITLSEAYDGVVLVGEQTVVFRGYYNTGSDWYFDGINWIEAQHKLTTNQAPKFDIFDSNNISLGDKAVYSGSSFAGCTLFEYALGTGTPDTVLGFPIKYSTFNTLGDISFDVTLNSQTFNYVDGTTPKTENVNTGYVFNYALPEVNPYIVEQPIIFDSLTRVKQTGWQTTVSPSIQYQIFEFDWSIDAPKYSFTCDILPVSATTTNWPTLQVYINNNYLDNQYYTVTTTETSTTIDIPIIDKLTTVIQVLIYSDQVSETAYYQIPTNLNNNPFNEDITSVNVGEIRGQYQSIFYNNPNTTGEVFGPNNYRDLGNLVPWGNAIIQNSASLVLPGIFLRKQEHNLFDALIYNSRQYITFKTLLIDTVNNSAFSTMMTPAEMLDDAMGIITTNRTDADSFFWSDMLPAKAPYVANTYSFANSLDVSTYPLSRIYTFETANYYGILVYLTRNNKVTQLIYGVDYTVSDTSPSLIITTDLLPNDQITINEYYQTYGNYVPNTPTKLGLYPATIPNVTLDTAYTYPTYFIVGHDGSYNKLYGDYNPTTEQLTDFRDQVLLEFEKRIYNNLKLSNEIPVQLYEILPGFFRTTDYTYQEFLQIYSESFLNWVGENRIDYKSQFYNKNNEFTFNYTNSGNKINEDAIEQGYFRGLYLYYYDTSTPNQTPWEMIGYTTQPIWWEGRYGPAPYTSDNTVLWGDLAAGEDWGTIDPVTGRGIVVPKFVRPGLLDVIPVDSNGNLLPPLESIVGYYDQFTFNRDWKVGDVGPAEFSYRRSSSWPFDLMRILALTKPADFFNLGVDVDIYKYNKEFDQYLVNDRSHLTPSDIRVYGSGTPATSYINWIIDYEKQVGLDATANITSLLNNLDVRLVYRMAGFSDKTFLNFYVEKSSANANNSALLIPNESYSLLLYENQPFDRIVYSGVVIQITENGYKVFGNSQTNAYFKILVPKPTPATEIITVESVTVTLTNDFYDTTVIVPYGTEFYNQQQVAEFLNSYGKYLETQGMIFESIENGIPVTWSQMVSEFLYWSQIGWAPGSITTINPAATLLSIDKDSYIVQPLTLQQFNFILNQNLYPIKNVDLNILRDGTLFTAQPLNSGDAISYGQFNISNIEHAVVFDNTTLFNDVIYNLPTGLRQNRLYLRGTKTAEWNGTLNPYGFILNQDNVVEWITETKYTKGSIVKYKNKYWSALKIIQASQTFNQIEWKEVPYTEIQKGLLLNSQTRSYESTLYYDINSANLENDADVLGFSLIGYRPRDYLAVADLTEITQVNVYKNMIKEKGTLNVLNAFKGATLPQGGINYDVYENWAIASGEFNGVLNNNFIQIKLNQSLLPSNPVIVSLTNGVDTAGSQQEIPIYSVFNYGRPINSPNILPTIDATTPSSLYPTAGYVNFNDVKMASYYYSGLSTAQNAAGTLIPIRDFYVRDYVWLANYLGTWNVYTPISLGAVINAKNNLNGTVTITFSKAHNLKRYQLIAIVNLNPAIDNYYIISAVIDPNNVIINLSLDPQITNITGLGVAMRMQSQRVATAPEIANLPSVIDEEFNKLRVWVDTNNDGSWAVYRKTLNYQYINQITKLGSESLGSAVAYSTQMGYLISDPTVGEVYRYRYNELFDRYDLADLLIQGNSFGSYISHSDDFFVISEPSGFNVYVYQLIITTTQDDVNLFQQIQIPNGVSTWGTATAISGDKNWLYISAISTASNSSSVYAYRFSTITEQYEFAAVLNTEALAADMFGYSIATDHYGETIIIGCPEKDYDTNIANYGYSYIFGRTVQTVIQSSQSIPYVPSLLQLAWTPITTTSTVISTSAGTNEIRVPNTYGFKDNDPVIFTGTLLSFGALAANTVYYIVPGFTLTTFQVSLTPNGSPIVLSNDTGSTMNVVVQTEKISVTINSTPISQSSYAVTDSVLYLYSDSTPLLVTGDIVEVSSSNFVLTQTLTNEEAPRVGVNFGTSVATNKFANEVLIGAPFELNDQNYEGAVHRFTNGGEKYGVIIGTSICNVTSVRTILLNGFAVNIPVGDATAASSVINASSIINVQASAVDGKLLIGLINTDISIPNKKLSLTVLNTDTLDMLGIKLYTKTQKITCPHPIGPTQFGTTIKLDNVSESIVISAPVGTRYVSTTFDFSDDELDNDTVFDNNTTRWVDTFANAGAVYMFDYLSVYNESLTEPGKYVYAQSTNAINIEYGDQPLFGAALDFNDNTVLIGSPNFSEAANGADAGQVVIYSSSSATPDWSVYRSSAPIIDIKGIFNIQLFSASTNQTLDNLDYIDPLQGKLLGAVVENLDVVSNVDPAGYNSPTNTQRGLVWGSDKVGQLWFDTSNTRFLNYHQNDNVYNSDYWGRVFPGSDVAVYSWIESNVVPAQYAGPGTPYDFDSFVTHGVINAEGLVVPVYYFWVRNTNIVFQELGKTLADSTLEIYIAQPQSAGISYFAPLLPNTFGLYNVADYINDKDTVLNIGYATSNNDNVLNTQYSLIRANFADDFLPGVPGSGAAYQFHSAIGITEPIGLYNKFLNSMAGVDEAGGVVPDPLLPLAVQTGVLSRPRQGFFYSRFDALANYLQYANIILAQFAITELKNIPGSYLINENPRIYVTDTVGDPVIVIAGNFVIGTRYVITSVGTTDFTLYGSINNEVGTSFIATAAGTGTGTVQILLFEVGEKYYTPSYWSYITWWAPGYDNNTKAAFQVPLFADLSTLQVSPGTIVSVAQNGSSNQETYIYNIDGTWTRIGLANGTIEFSSSLWDYSAANLGFGNNYFDTDTYDQYPSEETRYIIRALNEQIYSGDLLIFRNKSLILLFEYIQAETIESQNYLAWLNKTSLADVSHTIRELLPLEVFRSDNQDFLEGYINEAKPYHVVIKDFLFKYTGTDVFEGDITDFDLPAQYKTSVDQFISPALVYADPNLENEYLYTDSIWQTSSYNQWYNNYGLSIGFSAVNYNYLTGNYDGNEIVGDLGYPIAMLESYISTNTTSLYVNNASGFPVTGTILIDSEEISYTSVDTYNNVLTGLARGANGTTATTHLPGTTVFMNLPSVLVLYGGRAYNDPPIVTAYIDTTIYPAPRVAAKLQPIMNADRLIGVTVLEPGSGYAVLPKIIIDTAFTLDISSSQIDTLNNVIQLSDPTLQTGDLIRYIVPTGSTKILGLIEGQHYYVNTVETSPYSPVILFALYTSYTEAIDDHNRVVFGTAGIGTQQFSLGAVASCIANSMPIRENAVTIKLDRTSYTSSITDWTSGSFYGSEIFPNNVNFASSSVQLESSNPPIDSVLASAQGIPFEIMAVTNNQTITWSSRTRDSVQTYGPATSYPNTIRINPSSGGVSVSQDIGSTLGFYIGMPVQFQGAGFGNLQVLTTYYVKSLVQLPNPTTSQLENTGITISATIDAEGVPGSTFVLTSATPSSAGLLLLVGEVTNTAELTLNYNELRTITSTNSATNEITVNLTPTGQAGTTGFYTGLPIYFTVTNSQIVASGYFVIGQTYIIKHVGTTNFKDIGASANEVGVSFVATGEGFGTGTATLTTFGGIIENEVYYVTTVLDKYTFTMSTQNTAFNITATNIGITVNSGFFIVGNTYTIVTLGTTDFTTIGASVNQVGVVFVATNIGTGNGTASLAATITCASTRNLSLNEPIRFTGTTFGGIVAGTVYYVNAIFNGGTTFSISATQNGLPLALTAATGTCLLTSQKYVVPVTTSFGFMTLNVGISPVSPGQINGQLFTLYPTSSKIITDVQGTLTDLIERTITRTLATVNRLCLTASSGGTDYIYSNMNFNVGANIGGLTTSGGPYTVTGVGTTIVNVSETTGSGNWLILPVATNPNTTSVLYVGMPIIFTGAALGGVLLNVVYYVYAIDSSPPVSTGRFSITQNFSSAIILTAATGDMVGTGDTYIQVSNTLTSATGPVTLTQYHNPAYYAAFDIGYLLGGYSALIVNAGQQYAVTNKIIIPGTSLGGSTTYNDLTLTVSEVNSSGGIISVIRSGRTPGSNDQYYLKVLTNTTVGVYLDKAFTVPASGLNFPYTPVITTTATATAVSTNIVTVTDTSEFYLNDPIVFTGDQYGAGAFGNIALGETYYIKSFGSTINAGSFVNGTHYRINSLGNTNWNTAAGTSGIVYAVGDIFVAVVAGSGSGNVTTITQITISETIGGSVFVLANGSGTMTMAKEGDYVLLPDPFFFRPSIVKYNNRVYQCLISNNDTEFSFGKWQELFSRDRQLNALDRIIGYYEPTVNMPGVDLTQLVTGISYPGSTYKGNAFQPLEEYTLDAILINKPFTPGSVNVKAIIWDGARYITNIETSEYSAIATSSNAVDWFITKISNEPLNVTDFIYENGKYVMATFNNATPILYSNNGTSWSASVFYSYMNSITYYNGIYVAVGTSIASSSDTISWKERFTFDGEYENVFYGVTRSTTAGFPGYVAVGSGQQIVDLVLVDVPIIYGSTNLLSWNQFNFNFGTATAFYSVASNTDTIVAVGANGEIWTSFNLNIWFPQISTTVESLNNIIWDNVNSQFIAVGDNGTILTAPGDGITWTSHTSGTTTNLNQVIWNNELSTYVAVGDNSTVLTSVGDADSWVVNSSFGEDPAPYEILGNPFTYGYGPEELVPGEITDTMTMIVVTRPGTNWEESVYQHVGYNVVSLEINPTSDIQVTYSFLNATENPAQLSIFVIDFNTGLSIGIYEGIDYSINWINSTVTLVNPIYFEVPTVCDTLRIDVYEVGNGYQLVKSSTANQPLRINTTTGFQEIYTDANYSGFVSQGSGLIRTTIFTIEIIATATTASTDTILCNEVENLLLNNPIIFIGTPFGNILEDYIYFVKSINPTTNEITISETLVDGIAGPIFELSTDSGSMEIVRQLGAGAVWSTPAMFHNGTPLFLGTFVSVIATKASTDSILTNADATGSILVDSPIVFSNTMFGGVIVPQQTYYIKAILSESEFTISTTLGGPTLALTDANGFAQIVTNDYAIGLASNGITGNLIFANQYNTTVDYLVYSLFGETSPQYGYTVPITQTFIGDGSETTFTLQNYIGEDNPTNAIVEIDGLRVVSTTDYTIYPRDNNIIFTSPPASDSVIAITSYNLTSQQYLNTQVLTGIISSNIIAINNEITNPYAEIEVNSTTSGTNSISVIGVTNTDDLIEGQPISFQGPAVYGDSLVVGSQYKITFVGNTNFVALGASSNTVGVVFTATGTGPSGETGTAILTNFGGIDLLGTGYFIKTIIDLYDFTIMDENGVEIVLTNYVGAILGFMSGLPAVEITTALPNNLAQNDLVRLNGIVGPFQLNGNAYYVKVVNSTTFQIYNQPYNPTLYVVNYPVTNTLGYVSGGTVQNINEIVIVSDYQQINVDRLWVTINGYRVPSSSLRIYSNNELSILVSISPTDEIVITSMMPTATPNELTYLLNVSDTQQPSVYRANTQTRTWLTQQLSYSDSEIHVNDASHLTDSIVQNVTCPAIVDGSYYIGLAANKDAICDITVHNNTTNITLPAITQTVVIVDNAPILKITSGLISENDLLTITTVEGKILFIDGEMIQFGECDLATNTLSLLSRGTLGTGRKLYIPKDTEVFSLLPRNRMSDTDYGKTWNPIPGIYNAVKGDPLQIADTTAAIFLRTNIN